MSGGILNKIGRALSILGVSSPQDIRQMQQRKFLHIPQKAEADKSTIPSSQTSIQPKSKDTPPAE